MQALVVAAHGSHLNPDASDPTYAHADAIRETGVFDEVREAFWKEEPHFREVLRTLESEDVYVVPLFISEGYFTERVIPRELRLEGWDPSCWDSDGTSATHVTLPARDVEKTVHYCGPVGTHDAMSDVIVERAESVTGDPDVGDGFGLAVVGHGTERNANSAKAIEYHTDRIRERDRFDEVKALFMDEQPEVDDVTDFFACEDVVVVPLFVADGYHTQEDIPEDMGLTPDYRLGWEVPAAVDGHRIWYAGAVGTEPLMADVLVERAGDAGADIGNARDRLGRLDGKRGQTGPDAAETAPDRSPSAGDRRV
ncbi:CbiX/SirB N-terminal domain-containing protein [Halovivax gelatinilyticus]|uniref:CbiX/SirB N-terminal domain-containing protein n=1 Tax=Halovivax gelatinilyticus TaxID=2961597 RepID=UPI0020CA671A|nr:CbiX/SirB N-terminal domain-containing protein [Halovivax gelatinilyticus]